MRNRGEKDEIARKENRRRKARKRTERKRKRARSMFGLIIRF